MSLLHNPPNVLIVGKIRILSFRVKNQLREVLAKAFLPIFITQWQSHRKTEKKDMTKVIKRRNGHFTFLHTFGKVKDELPGLLTMSRDLPGVEKTANLSISREGQHIPQVRMPHQRKNLLIATRRGSTPASP